MLSDDQIKATILYKLHKRGNWGASHTAFDNIQKGFKEEDLGKHGSKRTEKLAKDLIRRGLIVTKPTHYGIQISLNPRMSESTVEFMKKFFPEI